MIWISTCHRNWPALKPCRLSPTEGHEPATPMGQASGTPAALSHPTSLMSPRDFWGDEAKACTDSEGALPVVQHRELGPWLELQWCRGWGPGVVVRACRCPQGPAVSGRGAMQDTSKQLWANPKKAANSRAMALPLSHVPSPWPETDSFLPLCKMGRWGSLRCCTMLDSVPLAATLWPVFLHLHGAQTLCRAGWGVHWGCAVIRNRLPWAALPFTGPMEQHCCV